MILVGGRVFVDPKDLPAFIVDTHAALLGAESENGCLFFSFAVEDAAAGSTLFLERWYDEDTLKTHLARQENIIWFEKWGTRMRIEMSKFDVLNERSPM